MGQNTVPYHRLGVPKSKGTLLFAAFVVVIFVTTLYRYSSWEYPRIIAFSSSNRLNLVNNLSGPGVAMDDPLLVDKLRKFFLEPPTNLDLNLTQPELADPSMGQSKVVRKLLHHQRNGFFIECGALDGETRSNTLYLERYLGWTGLLVEADPDNYRLMKYKHRNTWMSNACFSLKPYPMMVSFKQEFNTGAISDYPVGESRPGYVDVQCFPLYTFLLAINRTNIDYLSLDVEGGELDVLLTLPFKQVNIKVLSVEYVHVPQGKEELRLFMESQGYTMVETVIHKKNLANDFIFLKKD